MITANEFFNTSFVLYCARPRGILYNLAKNKLPLSLTVDESEPLKAYVNHGRWIVKCECGGAEKAWEEGLFMCQSCFNSAHKHHLRRSVFPKSRERIEKILSARPLHNRNCFPHESVKALERENREHKSELLED